VETKKTNNEKKSQEADFLFPCKDFQKMAEMMKNCCPGEDGVIDCCSMMRRMMDPGKGAGAKETKETQKPPKGGENG
jgi:hypothetical protein